MRVRSAVPAAFAAALLAAPAAAGAQPACVAGTLESYIGLGAAGCTIGAATVGRFGVNQFRNYTGPVTLTPYTRAEGVGTVVGFTLGFPDPLSVSRTFGGPVGPTFFQDVLASVCFAVDAGAGNLIRGAQFDGLSGTVTRTSAASDPLTFASSGGSLGIGFQLCSNEFDAVAVGNVSDGCADRSACVTTRSDDLRGPGQRARPVSIGGVVAYLTQRETFATPVTYGATLASVTGGVYYAPAAAVVPEPSTFALAAVGGLALGAGAVRRRRRRAA